MQLKYAKNPKWSNATRTSIDITICWDAWDTEFPFTATENDPEEHGRDIYSLALAGEYGVVAEFTPPTPDSLEVQATNIRNDRNGRLASTDWTQMLDVPEATKSKWAEYRQALRNVPQQVGFPAAVTWPTSP